MPFRDFQHQLIPYTLVQLTEVCLLSCIRILHVIFSDIEFKLIHVNKIKLFCENTYFNKLN